MHEFTVILKACFCFLVHFLVILNLDVSFQKSNPFPCSRISGTNGGSICSPAIYICVKQLEAVLEWILKVSLLLFPLSDFISLARNFLGIFSKAFYCENQALLNINITEYPQIILPMKDKTYMKILFRLIFLKSINIICEYNIKYQ